MFIITARSPFGVCATPRYVRLIASTNCILLTGWDIKDIPDPKDPDPLRYAMIASIVEELHEAMNWRLSLGLRRNKEHVYRETNDASWPPFSPQELPKWTAKVPPMDKDLLRQSVPPESLDAEGNLVLEKGGKGPNFLKRNIITNTGWLYTI
ncbi:hypothetical protein N7466_007423 [Penicillium verhagenii]|uniref:uncharacterized protein n=1 Tax=Penicillium verhagenii TaxID=1562060 RepID=UPI0025453730|nr:uncharacterized protein N7466_007423 [Penicillium verhagenii]KAJ5928467.1 hypothetical protein N7466_007423 [Penicillium verhagenii]